MTTEQPVNMITLVAAWLCILSLKCWIAQVTKCHAAPEVVQYIVLCIIMYNIDDTKARMC